MIAIDANRLAIAGVVASGGTLTYHVVPLGRWFERLGAASRQFFAR